MCSTLGGRLLRKVRRYVITAGDCPWLGPKRPNPAGEARYEPDIVDWYNCILVKFYIQRTAFLTTKTKTTTTTTR